MWDGAVESPNLQPRVALGMTQVPGPQLFLELNLDSRSAVIFVVPQRFAWAIGDWRGTIQHLQLDFSAGFD
jgi:hypothetical protein